MNTTQHGHFRTLFISPHTKIFTFWTTWSIYILDSLSPEQMNELTNDV
jgi:hypothetical protein